MFPPRGQPGTSSSGNPTEQKQSQYCFARRPEELPHVLCIRWRSGRHGQCRGLCRRAADGDTAGFRPHDGHVIDTGRGHGDRAAQIQRFSEPIRSRNADRPGISRGSAGRDRDGCGAAAAAGKVIARLASGTERVCCWV